MRRVTIPAGITWKRTGRLTSVCTIRREPETVVEYELSDLQPMSVSELFAPWFAYRAPLATAMSPQVAGGSLLGGIFGNIGI